MNEKHTLLNALASSPLYQEYERAFTEATGLPVALKPPESWHLPLRDKRHENAWCAGMSQKSSTCASCLQTQQKLTNGAVNNAHSVTCPHGLVETAVPVRVGDKLVGFLHTGQVFLRKPSLSQFERSLKLAGNHGQPTDPEELKKMYFETRVLTARQYESMVKLLGIFAQHLSMLSNQLVLQQQNAVPPVITRAKQFITEKYTENVSLGQVARTVNTSPFYFCKIFKRSTGLNFTEYLARVRVEKAKNLLLNPNLRISEIAFEVGFQSLTHFNRVFKKLMGQSPTEYREQLLTAAG